MSSKKDDLKETKSKKSDMKLEQSNKDINTQNLETQNDKSNTESYQNIDNNEKIIPEYANNFKEYQEQTIQSIRHVIQLY